MGASHQVFLDVDDVMRDHFFLRRSEPKKQGNNFSEFTTVLFTTYLKTHRPVYYYWYCRDLSCRLNTSCTGTDSCPGPKSHC